MSSATSYPARTAPAPAPGLSGTSVAEENERDDTEYGGSAGYRSPHMVIVFIGYTFFSRTHP